MVSSAPKVASNDVANVFFHGAQLRKGVGQRTSKTDLCNTTGLIRAIRLADKSVSVEVAITIIRRVADPGDYHRGLTNALKGGSSANPSSRRFNDHLCIDATGILVQAPVTHGHIITVVATPKEDISKEELVAMFKKHPRIRVVQNRKGFEQCVTL